MSKTQEDRGTAIVYYCHCGQCIILTSGESAHLQRGAGEAGVAIIDSYDHAYCPECGKSLASVWESLVCSRCE